MNLHLRMPQKEPGESNLEYSQRLSDEAQVLAKISMVFAVVSIVLAVISVVIG